MKQLELVRGSYRDPNGRVFRHQGRIFRTIMPRAIDDFNAVEASGLFTDLVERGWLVPLWDAPLEIASTIGAGEARLLEHEPLPLISYPYEWPFGALKAAAVFHLDFHIHVLDHGSNLTDATAYNVQFKGGQPIFIDHLSLRPYRDGEFWTGHHQFCEQFLNPLLLRARLGIAHHAWYRGAPDGIPSADLCAALPWGALFNPGLFTNLFLPVWFERRKRSNREVSASLSRRRLPKEGYRRMLVSLRNLISKLHLPDEQTVWRDYERTKTYTNEEDAKKHAFVGDFCREVCPAMIWDFGCNTGAFSETALKSGAGYVVGFEFDAGALEGAYRRSVENGLDFLPLHMDAVNPTPSQGWNQSERDGLIERRNADGVLALALIHHIAIGRNVPLPEVIAWIIGHAPQGVIEFVPKGDPMVQELLQLREDIFDDYTDQAFDAALGKLARVVREETVTESGRRLVWFERA